MPAATASTRLVGILGWPVSHSLSPRMHNAAFAALGLDWAYLPLPVEPDRVGDAVRGLVALGLAGANVTIPHKQAVIPFCDALEPVAARCGSVNTLVVGPDGSLLGTSTDGRGADRVDPTGRPVVLLGAGGAARPVAVALADRGAGRLVVAARRAEAAAELAGALAAAVSVPVETALAWPPPVPDGAVVVNATPLKDDAIVTLGGGEVVVDLAYRADGLPTALAAAAVDAGCELVDGLEFLVRQGAASFERWTGRAAPLDVMEAAARGRPPDPAPGEAGLAPDGAAAEYP